MSLTGSYTEDEPKYLPIILQLQISLGSFSKNRLDKQVEIAFWRIFRFEDTNMRTAIFRKTKLTCRDIPTHRGHRSRHGHQANHSHKSHSWRHWLFHFHVHSGHHWQTHHDGRRLWSHLKLHLELRFPATDYDWHLSIPGCNGSKLPSPSHNRTCIDCCRPKNLDGESDGTVSTANLGRTKRCGLETFYHGLGREE